MKQKSVKLLAKIAILSSVAFILMLFEFPLPFLPFFYKMDFSETAVLIGGFAMGPGAAVVIEALKNLLYIWLHGSMTGGVGEIANFIVGCALCVPAAVIYRKQKTKQTAEKGMLVGSILMIIAGVLANYYVLLPLFASIDENYSADKIVELGNSLIPAIHNMFDFVLLATAPFNAIKALLVCVVTMIVYKRISPILHR
jgi:riboflavin transporter FmnP